MTTPAARFARLPPEKQARLLDPAEAEFVEHGFENASLNRILTAAGMSKGQAYHYITSKADLYLLVCTRRFVPLLDRAAADLCFDEDVPFWSVVTQSSAALAATLDADDTLSALARGVYDSAGGQAALAPLASRVDDLLNRLTAHGLRAGVMRDDVPPELLRDVLKGAAISLDRWFAHSAATLPPEKVGPIMTAAIQMLRNMVAPESAGNA